MAKSFSELRKQSTNLEKLQRKIKSRNKNDYTDDRFWRAEQDKAGNAQAVIRFLPAPPGEEDPFVKLFSIGFQGKNNKWFIENCPSTIGKPSPVLESNNKLWDLSKKTGNPEYEKLARSRKRKLSYISNILVVKDPANPENEGKVFLFKYGAKIFEKLESAMVPQFEGDDPINVFDPWEGADFKLRIVRSYGNANYDNSTFDNPAPISEDDSEIEELWNKEYSLQEFVAEDQFKSYEELKKKFEFVTEESAENQNFSVNAEEDFESVQTNSDQEEDELPWSNDDDDDSESLELSDDDDDLDDFYKLVENN